MHCLTFTLEPPNVQHPGVVVYLPFGQCTFDDIEDDFREIFRRNLTARFVLLVTLQLREHDQLLDHRVANVYRKVINPNSGTLKANTFRLRVNYAGAIEIRPEVRSRLASFIQGGQDFDERVRGLIKNGFADYLIRARPIILRSRDSRFSKPSGRTSDYFIHAANAVSDSRDVEFMSLFILPLLEGRTTRVYVDTVVISPIVYSALLLRTRLHPKDGPVSPTIESYHSYEGLRKGFRLQTTLSRVLVSASTSGGMREELVKRFNFPAGNICTLFGPRGSSVESIFSLPIDIGSAITPASRATHLVLGGEMFWPESQPPPLMDVTLRDRPAWLTHFGELYFGTKAIRCHFSNAAHTSSKDAVYIAIERAWRLQQFRRAADEFFVKILPLKVGLIVWSQDVASREIARDICDRYYRSRPLLFSEDSLSSSKASTMAVPSGTIALVIGSVVASGRSFLKISQGLRDVRHLSGITYVSLLNRFSSTSREKYITANLLQGSCPAEYLWHTWIKIQMPDCSDVDALSFEQEKRFLQERQSSFSTSTFWRKRQQAYIDAVAFVTGGFYEDIFLPTFDGKQLRLRNGFALYRQRNGDRRLSHSEVFSIATAYLYEERKRAYDTGTSPSPISGMLVDPSVFTRFNDGVLHAAMLRACHPSELDYSTRQTESADLRNLLIGYLKAPRKKLGEASGEFLLALAMRRIRLCIDDYEVLVHEVDPEVARWPEHYKLLWNVIRTESGSSG
jgi:hypothetical protein